MRVIVLFLILIFVSNSAIAGSRCDDIEIINVEKEKVILSQREVDGGFQELILAKQLRNGNEKIARISFSGSKEISCHFSSIALLKGGDWGWHVAWASTANRGVFYARVDGEAWVSSLPKRLSRESALMVSLTESKGKLTISINYSPEQKQEKENFVSEDEGRSWDKLTP